MSSDIARLGVLRALLAELETSGHRNDLAIAGTRSDIRMIEADWPDERLLAAHAAAVGRGDAERRALRAEIAHRDLRD